MIHMISLSKGTPFAFSIPISAPPLLFEIDHNPSARKDKNDDRTHIHVCYMIQPTVAKLWRKPSEAQLTSSNDLSMLNVGVGG